MFKTLAILSVGSLCAAAQSPVPPPTPQNLRPPAGQKLLLKAKGVGDQIYTCRSMEGSFAWTLKAPDARLLDGEGKLIGHHFAGPAWEATDGSRVVAKVSSTMTSPDPHSIPWLLLSATEHHGNGVMQDVLSIQRLNTEGGRPPANSCGSSQQGAQLRVPYKAEYDFYGVVK
jgi:hypothetical protein